MKKLVIYTKNNCPYCVQAKNFLKMRNVEFEEINIEEDQEARNWLINVANHKTVPQIYFDNYKQDNPQIFVEGGFQGLNSMTNKEFFKQIE